MDKISSWASQIIVAVIIGTIIEMILPKGNNKKYIKMVIGVYILFTILSPVITNAFGKNLKLNMQEYEEYFKNSTEYKTLSDGFSKSTDISIENTYNSALKKDIKEKLNKKGYNTGQINLEIELELEERYGCINKMDVSIVKQKIEDEKEENKNSISINKVEIGKQEKKQEKQILSQDEIIELVQFLSQEYGVHPDNITIL